MSGVQKSRQLQPEKSPSTRKSPRKSRQQATSTYFEQQHVSDASDDEDTVVKPPARASTKKGPKMKRKLEDEEDHDDDDASDATPPKKQKIYDSDALDEDSDFGEKDNKKVKKARSSSNHTPKKKTQSPRKKKKPATEFEDELKEGQEIVGVVVQAPKTGRVPPGQISQNTLDFLAKLKDPACNDREWFAFLEPVYRLAEKEWKDFVEAFTEVLAEVDNQIPHLPPKDVIHRIYRDIRFSNDKTPYKKGVSASFSRSGRKGIFAGCEILVKPGNESIIAAGSWCPGKNELATIRLNIQRNPRRLRDVIAAPEFVKFFGKAKPHPKGERQNIFGMEDELKVAPKGVDKDHKDIDLLKCRSFAVVHRFTDSEVLAPDFKEKLADVARVMQPLVHCLNDMMTILGAGGDGGEEEEDEEEGEQDDGEEAE
ncbi:hypothetical protein M413DRAFT_449309 [Hebeloma cylindrosporum]|uniref:Uncharacterized protein n=1 Tax=Hebeloma cylindrosporum TaxID=76867 RepID=A0A0C2XEC3_HEBCY|nr:hypothetical protein M413DRAFT_449309 [Hebeloma cylindrosporum h7]